jgi:predicted O-methyltransferase YrrM
MQIIQLSDAHNAVARLKKDYISHSEMAPSERDFLTALIQKYKPQKIVEIGIAAGSSSVLLLNALSDLPNKKLIRMDYATQYYRDTRKKSGFIVDEYPELKENWTLYTGGLVSEFVDQIGDGIDFCFIDTMHLIPGEIIDFLAIFPFLKKNAVVVFHDTNLQTWGYWPNANVNNLLISALSGEKLIPERHEKTFYHNILKKDVSMPFCNIAGVVLDSNQKERIWDVFNLLTQNWSHMLKTDDLNSFRRVLKEHYDSRYTEFFNDVVAYQKNAFTPAVSTAAAAAAPVKLNRRQLQMKYRRYNMLSKIFFGSLRTRYKLKSLDLKSQLKSL